MTGYADRETRAGSGAGAHAVATQAQDRIVVRKATRADAGDIWTWRNDPCTRAMSVNADEVAWASHARWFDAALKDRDRRLYLGALRMDGRKIGMCRFDVDPGSALARVSINLNPAMRGLGLSAPLLALAVRQFLNERPLDLAATVRNGNLASIRCFTRCGFTLCGEDAEYAFYRLAAATPPAATP